MKLTIKGSVPSKKNSKRIVCRGKRPMLLSSRDYYKWHSEALYELRNAKKIPEGTHLQMTIKIFTKDRRKADLTNKAESIMDTLVDAKILPDDNWYIVPVVTLRFGGVDKENPRAEIEIISIT